uniref:Uncharacterized protein n=1 Tax=Rhodnius prolixus TaxID=13249 RepID=T1HUP2_RHOPR
MTDLVGIAACAVIILDNEEKRKRRWWSYIVQVEDRLCFLKIWHTSLQTTFHRLNPKFFFLPDCKNKRKHAMEILSAQESDITVNIVVAEIDFNDINTSKFGLNHHEGAIRLN